jgi:hypothetical protein
MSEYRWMKTDTASIMFSSLSSKKWGRTFRNAAVFKDIEIDEALLIKAAEDLKARYPSMHTRIKKGFFWNYQEFTDALPEIRPEHSRVLLPITMRDDNRPDFRIVYHKRRIAMECAHHLGDGKGATEYFKALIKRYVELSENPDSEYILTKPTEAELSNAYADYYIKGGEKPDDNAPEAYHLDCKSEKDFLQLIFAFIPVEELRKNSKAKGLTISEYMVAALILGTLNHAKKPITDPIVIAVPVNLRNFFPSDTVRNFAVQSKIHFEPKGRTDWTFDEICSEIAGQLKKNTAPSELQKQLNKFGDLVNNPVLKIVPYFIKQPVLKASQKKTHAGFTTIFTNIGNIEIDPAVSSAVERFEGINGDTSGYGLVSTCSAMSCNGILSLCFSVCSHDTSWQKECVRVLTSQGLTARIESTHGNGVNNK